MKKIWVNEYVYNLSVDCDAVAAGVILDTHKYLIKKYDIK